MFTASAELYDLIYSRMKDYAAEAGQIARLVREVHARARTILDVACGTGEHASRLARDHGFQVDGIDRDPGLLRIARHKHAAGHFVEADMCAFDLGRQYDVVTCLFSSIGYAGTWDRMRDALRCFRTHTAPDGVVMVEPWFAPGFLQHGYVGRNTGEGDGVLVERTSRTEVFGRVSRLHFEYRIVGPDGVREAREVHELGLFTVDEVLAAFREAGLEAAYDSSGLTGRGLYLARAAAPSPRRVP